VIELGEKGLHCPSGGFHIDPTRGVDVALITHAHSDHARRGSQSYVCAAPSVRLLRLRLGEKANIRGVGYRERLRFGDTTVSFHPAGHILGSAQIRVERAGEVWVVSGDYKREPDPTCEPFEPLACDTFITEATFGSPSYEWGDSAATVREIHEWWRGNAARGRNSLLYCYAVGKTQRVLAGLADHTGEPAYVFGEAAELTEAYRAEGVRMIPTRRLEDVPSGARLEGALVIAPHSIGRTGWPERLGDCETAFASGWMRTGAFGARRAYDRGFVLSDHADWPGLLRTIEETGARRVRVHHGGEGALTRHLRARGVDARALRPPSPQGELF
jgi:putative mRNA 3-end processing factor